MSLKDVELNNLEYPLVSKHDQRNFCQYYISLLRTNHLLFFSFFNKKDYNSTIIKIDLFFMNFAISYTINALFFSDDTMHKIYEDKGKFNIIYQLPQIAYSTLISTLLNFLLKMLALSEGKILSFKQDKNLENLKQREEKLNKILKIKFFLFFIFSIIFLLGFWYYLSMFCAIYTNTQIHLVKDTLLSFGISLIYPFAICLLPAIFRFISLSNNNEDKKCLYGFSQILQKI